VVLDGPPGDFTLVIAPAADLIVRISLRPDSKRRLLTVEVFSGESPASRLEMFFIDHPHFAQGSGFLAERDTVLLPEWTV
jgi:hypothetical protein